MFVGRNPRERYARPELSLRAQKTLATSLGVVVVGILVGLYVTFLTGGPTPYRVPVARLAAAQAALATKERDR